MTETAAAAPTPSRPSRGRSIGVWAALVVAGLLLLLSSFAVWVNRVALNTDVFVDTSAELLDNDAIRSAVATRAVDELFTNVDVQAEIEEQLPTDYKSLSGPATAGLQQASYQLVDRALERPAVQKLWALSLEASHKTLVAVLEDDTRVISTTGGVVTLDLEPIVLEAADRIGIRSQIEGKLPADVGRIEILQSDELDTAQNGFQILKTLAWFLPLLALAMFGAAIWLARDRRRAVRSIGFVVLAVGLIGLVAVNVVGTYVVNSLTSATDVRTAASEAWAILSELLRGSFRAFVVIGLLFVATSWLAGIGRRAVAVRRTLAPTLRDRVWPYAVLGLVLLFLLLRSPVTDFTRVLFVVLFAALGITWIELMRRQTLAEFPTASGAAYLSDARGRLSGWWDEQRRARTARPTAPAQPAEDLAASLARLAELHASGALSDDEYTAAKTRLLSGS
ncbi:MAG: SHOCT domain-containing protein [Gaiellaceae bacterium]